MTKRNISQIYGVVKEGNGDILGRMDVCLGEWNRAGARRMSKITACSGYVDGVSISRSSLSNYKACLGWNVNKSTGNIPDECWCRSFDAKAMFDALGVSAWQLP